MKALTPEEIAEKYVHGKHNALTDSQEKKDMVNDINRYVKSNRWEEKDKIIEQQEIEICDRNYLIAELSGEDCKNPEELKERLLNEGLGVKELLKEMAEALNHSLSEITIIDEEGNVTSKKQKVLSKYKEMMK